MKWFKVMGGTRAITILVISSVTCKRKSKKIKTKNQKMRTKKYKKASLYTDCIITGVPPSDEQEGTINLPINVGFETNIY